jgi:hypothetical protein
MHSHLLNTIRDHNPTDIYNNAYQDTANGNDIPFYRKTGLNWIAELVVTTREAGEKLP